MLCYGPWRRFVDRKRHEYLRRTVTLDAAGRDGDEDGVGGNRRDPGSIEMDQPRQHVPGMGTIDSKKGKAGGSQCVSESREETSLV